MLPRTIFENLHAVMAILVLFEQFSRKFCFILFLAPNFEYFTKYDALCLQFRLAYAC